MVRSSTRRAQRKSGEWLRRYGPLEVAGTLSAVLGAFLVHGLTGNLATSAVAGAWAENVGYYGTATWREARRNRVTCPTPDRMTRLRRFLRTAGAMIIEFGPAELFDSALLRPALMYAGPHLVGSVGLGLLVGKSQPT